MSNTTIATSLSAVTSFLESAFKFDDVKGYLSQREGFLLQRLAAEGDGVGQIAEIGSFMGRSTCWLASGSKMARREKVYAIDHFKGSPEHQKGGTHEVTEIAFAGSTLPRFTENLKRHGLDDHIVPIVSDSLSAAAAWNKEGRGVIRLLFIDGDHSYEATKADFDAWSRHIGPRGYVAFHDVGPWEGVTKFYQELVAAKGHFRPVLAVDTLHIMQRSR